MWSLGCVIAELFLGWPLYPGASEYDQVRAHGRCGNVQMKLQWSAFGPSEANVSYIKFHLVQITVVWHLKFIFPLWYSHCLFLLYREPKSSVWFDMSCMLLSNAWVNLYLTPWLPNPKAVEIPSSPSRSEVCVPWLGTPSVISPWGQFFHVETEQAHHSCSVNTYSRPHL